MTRLPGLRPSRCACGLRGSSTGHPCPVEKLAASMRPPCGLSSTRPPRHTGTPRHEPYQEPSNGRRCRAVARCRSALVRDQPERCTQRCGRAQVRSYRGGACVGLRAISLLWERTLCATNLRSDPPTRGSRAQGALPQTSTDIRGRGTQETSIHRFLAILFVNHATLHHEVHLLHHGDVFDRVAGDGDDVGHAAHRDLA